MPAIAASPPPPAPSTVTDLVCGPLSNVSLLMKKYHEIIVFYATVPANSKEEDSLILMITANPSNGTWTEFLINKLGNACIINEGVNASFVLTSNETKI